MNILAKAKLYLNLTKGCNLCTTEKYYHHQTGTGNTKQTKQTKFNMQALTKVYS